MAEESLNSVAVSEETLRKIRSLGDLNSSEESVILDLIKHVRSCDGWWENRFD